MNNENNNGLVDLGTASVETQSGGWVGMDSGQLPKPEILPSV